MEAARVSRHGGFLGGKTVVGSRFRDGRLVDDHGGGLLGQLNHRLLCESGAVVSV